MKNKILVTGAFGFVGSHLVEHLVENNYNVIAFDRYNNDYNYGNLEFSKYKNDIEFILGDIRDFDSVNKSLERCDSCLHLAALIGIPYSYVSPLAYIKTNLEGTYNILESVKNLNLNQVIITSTSEVYGTAKKLPIDENHSLNAQSPYSASKIAADNLALSYFNSFGLPVKIIRPFNTFGPRQSARAIIPTIISQTINNEKSIKLGNLDVGRDFTYVTDICNAFELIIKNDNFFGDVVNVGNNKMITVKDLIKLIFKIVGREKKIIKEKVRIRKKGSEVENLMADNSKFISLSEWRPQITLSEGIERTYNWMLNNKNKFDKLIYYV